MNTLFKSFALASLALLILTGSAIAGGNKQDKVDKTTQKARNQVEAATPDDWMALAKAAEMCINKETNLQEAAEWLDKSLAIKRTPYNLEIKGDYYMISNLPQKALEYYVESLSMGKQNDFYFDGRELQTKINELHRQLN